MIIAQLNNTYYDIQANFRAVFFSKCFLVIGFLDGITNLRNVELATFIHNIIWSGLSIAVFMFLLTGDLKTITQKQILILLPPLFYVISYGFIYFIYTH